MKRTRTRTRTRRFKRCWLVGNEKTDESMRLNITAVMAVTGGWVRLERLYLAVPTLPTFVNTRQVLDAFNMSNSDPTNFDRIEDVQHFSNLFGSDCFSLIALCSLYVLADAAENTRLVRRQRLKRERSTTVTSPH